jgi:hypothetical protein
VQGVRRRTVDPSVAKVPQDLLADVTMRHLMGDFAQGIAGEAAYYHDRAGEFPTENDEYAERGLDMMGIANAMLAVL